MVAQPVDFAYRLTGTGWSEASLRIGEQVVHLTASYLGDALGDFLTAIVLLTEGAGDVRASWQEEPGEYRFVLTREGERVRVRVLAFADAWPEQPDEAGRNMFDATCSFDALLNAVVAGSQVALSQWGVDGYRQKWVEHDFPLAELQTLEYVAATRD